MLRTGAELLNDMKRIRLLAVYADAAYRTSTRADGKTAPKEVSGAAGQGVADEQHVEVKAT